MIGLHGLPPSKLCKEHVKRHPRQCWEKHPLWEPIPPRLALRGTLSSQRSVPAHLEAW